MELSCAGPWTAAYTGGLVIGRGNRLGAGYMMQRPTPLGFRQTAYMPYIIGSEDMHSRGWRLQQPWFEIEASR